MRSKGALISIATAGLVVLLASAFAFSLYDLVSGAPAGGPPKATPVSGADLPDIEEPPAASSDAAADEPSIEQAVGNGSIYPTPLGSARCWVKQGRVQPGQSPEFKVQVRDTAGKAVSGAPVEFSLAGETFVSGSFVAPTADTTGPSGIASTVVTAGSLTDTAGFVQVKAAAGGGSNSVACQAVILVR